MKMLQLNINFIHTWHSYLSGERLRQSKIGAIVSVANSAVAVSTKGNFGYEINRYLTPINFRERACS